MARNENPPFERGSTWSGVGGSLDLSDQSALNWEGKTWVFEDIQISTPGLVGAKPTRTNRDVVCMVVRNMAPFNLLPCQLANLQTTGADGRYYLGRVDGLASVAAQRAYPVDEWLPAAGVQQHDLFWIVLKGPACVLTDLAGGATNNITVGQKVVALTAASSGATTAGRVYPQDLTGATAALGNQIQNAVGWSLSAATTGNTNQRLLVEIGNTY